MPDDGRQIAFPQTGAGTKKCRTIDEQVMSAFHQACDQTDLEVARALLLIAERALARQSHPNALAERRRRENVVAGHERLWHLLHSAEAN